MSPMFRGYQECSFSWRRTQFERTQEAGRVLSQECVLRMNRYNFPTQELLGLIWRQHGLHAALLAMEALERQRDVRFPLAFPEL